jgi:hypothetical protein
MKIGVYALARNEEKHAAAWAESCRGADVRIVTDTGSTDGTVAALEAAGVTVTHGNVVPWRWDDAHNLSLYHLPADVDVCIRLDLDERIQPGWREAIERAWVDGVNQLRYRYVWSWRPDGRPGLVFHSDRVHARVGFRWNGATHEGLIAWALPARQATAAGLEIHHHRDAGKRHKSDLPLLMIAAREAPHDARAQWYLAREMDYESHAGAAAAFRKYLEMPGRTPTEESYARRSLYRLAGDPADLHAAAAAAPAEPDAWLALARLAYAGRRWAEVVDYAGRAVAADGPGTHATDPAARGAAADLLSIALWETGRRPEGLTFARQAAADFPEDARIAANVRGMAAILAARSVEAVA